MTKKEALLASEQEMEIKYIERALGVLPSKWHIISRPDDIGQNK